ncbi:DUF4249 domain-containing protein [Spirosoma pollinicola]|uniref:DUF4249 domain-containing protein n=1 Tax=Spirosoma pollinicola TaxID=2057025 RepID=A0A2K8ZB50_9BACT|nr:DUF4249 domain-containing protein [Spirosoma pollinicola]AUD07074.1 DUF4249 domain-containing protein [Spirosoma pollinicola]
MRLTFTLIIGCLAVLFLPLACVDPEDILLHGTVNVLVVDGTITNLAEPQMIRINRSKADPLTGRFGTTPITKAQVQVVVDSTQMIDCHETQDGTYQLPSDFKGQIGHAYQLRFTLSDGTRYQSTTEVMASVPPFDHLSAQFNPNSLEPAQRLAGNYAAAHDFYLDTQDPVETRNYYRWSWVLWEKQDWCRTCENAVYLIWDPSDTYLYENCYDVSQLIRGQYFVYDYACRTQCWDIFYSPDINVFSDQLTNGGPILHRRVAQIPFYDHNGALVEIRQTGLTQSAYTYFKLFQDQTQNTGGLADTPAAAPIGNVHNVANRQEAVVGYFTAGAVFAQRYWLDRKDSEGIPPGLFELVHGRVPQPEPVPSLVYIYSKYYVRPPTAVCVSSDSRTPSKPVGWQD